MQKKLFKSRNEWRQWLEKFHDKESELWLVFYKVKASKVSIKYEEAVEEALCYGWIDSTVRRIDDEKHMQRYTPRKLKSNWSTLNKKRVSMLIKKGLMTDYGMQAITAAKKNGSWERLDDIEVKMEIPKELSRAFAKDKAAKKKYDSLAPSRKKQFLYWITSAKREQTKEKRISETIKMLLDDEGPV